MNGTKALTHTHPEAFQKRCSAPHSGLTGRVGAFRARLETTGFVSCFQYLRSHNNYLAVAIVRGLHGFLP